MATRPDATPHAVGIRVWRSSRDHPGIEIGAPTCKMFVVGCVRRGGGLPDGSDGGDTEHSTGGRTAPFTLQPRPANRRQDQRAALRHMPVFARPASRASGPQPNSLLDRPQQRPQYPCDREPQQRSSRERCQSVDSDRNLMISACGERSDPRTYHHPASPS